MAHGNRNLKQYREMKRIAGDISPILAPRRVSKRQIKKLNNKPVKQFRKGSKCFFCGTVIVEVVTRHHIIPRSIARTDQSGETIPLHVACHAFIHKVWTNAELATMGWGGLMQTKIAILGMGWLSGFHGTRLDKPLIGTWPEIILDEFIKLHSQRIAEAKEARPR